MEGRILSLEDFQQSADDMYWLGRGAIVAKSKLSIPNSGIQVILRLCCNMEAKNFVSEEARVFLRDFKRIITTSENNHEEGTLASLWHWL